MVLLTWLEKTVDGCFSIIPRREPSPGLLQSVRLIAHRGAHNYAQGIIENTLPAFALAKKLGCWGIEFDVHSTADNVLVVNHDPTLKRLWGHPQQISKINFNALRALAPQVPTLQEVVAAYGSSMHLLIELKTMLCDESLLINELQHLSASKNYHLLTLNEAIFASLTQFANEALLLVAGHNNVEKFCNLCVKKNYAGVLGHYLLLRNKAVNHLKSAQKIVGVGMVDSQFSVYRELNRGVNWLFTNRAAEVSAHLQSKLTGS